MTADDQTRYGRLRAMCEFMTNVASAMEYSGGLNQVSRNRLQESIKPVREAREWMWDIGQMMIPSQPLPAGLHEALEITESRALDALPKLKAALDEACEEFLRAARRPVAPRGGGMSAVADEAQ
ncbi:hypothetical protein DFR50_106128 [Roseiarcus fermentans]|uniref:Uncharacterized protein n=1 Tax=Roseiarcus fermentans TaxID=1473586 RepID=A0A366FPV5_9HYPH|nr:hypothetical protein [Roseiarcus fermentans]RBP16166.1 hypothetical protein DFR50_106128 [Roseiarcus fermentans]